ncbi:hypothetical protein BH10BAC5_BH10BAC5_02640 [soil metagenome]
MSKIKEEVNKLVDNLSEESTLEDVQYHLYVMQKITQGLEDINNNRVHTHDQVKEKVAKWLEK